MTDLPVCRLCKFAPELNMDNGTYAACMNKDCELFDFPIKVDQWRKLMYVPKKRGTFMDDNSFDIAYRKGYNAAIDEMKKGGV